MNSKSSQSSSCWSGQSEEESVEVRVTALLTVSFPSPVSDSSSRPSSSVLEVSAIDQRYVGS